MYNKVHFGKWLWRFGHERDNLGAVVIVQNYSELKGGWCSNESHGIEWVSLGSSLG